MFRWLCILTVLTGFIVYPINLLGQAIGLENAVSAWLFNEGTGTTTINYIEGGPDGVLVGNPTWVAGLYETALQFDGVDDAMEVGTNPLIGAHSLTVQAYIKPSGVPDFSSSKIFNIALERSGGGTDRFMFEVAPNGEGWGLSHFMSIAGERSEPTAPGAVHPFNDWYHVAMVFDSVSASAVTIKHYVNHALELEMSFAFGSLNEGKIFIGERYEPNSAGSRCYFQGIMDNVVLHKKVLNPDEFMPVPGSVGIDDDNSSILPTKFALYQNYPNPFNPVTTINYDIPQGMRVQVKLEIFNLLGQHVSTLVGKIQQAGYYSVCWDGRNIDGGKAPSGIYFLVLQARNEMISRKMTLIR
jgi:hypothetical protein